MAERWRVGVVAECRPSGDMAGIAAVLAGASGCSLAISLFIYWNAGIISHFKESRKRQN